MKRHQYQVSMLDIIQLERLEVCKSLVSCSPSLEVLCTIKGRMEQLDHMERRINKQIKGDSVS